eukprot:COSAG03_NODE_14540_length_460_cov_1.191136_1_plen_26_part_01
MEADVQQLLWQDNGELTEQSEHEIRV